MTDRKIIQKIKALMAKATGTDNEFEAETFMAKAHELLVKHNIALHELGDAANDDDPIETSFNEFRYNTSNSWKGKLLFIIAKYFECGTVVSQVARNKFEVNIIGRESARITNKLMAPCILDQVNYHAKQLASTYGLTVSVAQRRVANALTLRINSIVAEREAKVQENKGSGYELILVDQIEAKISQDFGNTYAVRSSRISTSRAARKAAEGISLARQTEGTRTRRLT